MIWLIVAACLLVSFVFSGIEAGILSVNRVRLRHRVKQGDPAALRLGHLLAEPKRLLITVLIVTNLANIFAITLTAGELVRWLGPRGYLVAFVLFLPIYMMGVELLPKSLFRRFPYRALAALARPIQIVDAALTPLRMLGGALSSLLLGKDKPDEKRLFVAREDFKYLTIETERAGALTHLEREMIHNVVDFRAVMARDVMLPMAGVQWIAAAAPVSELIERHRATHLDRWPVRAPDGAVTGLVNILDLALELGRHQTVGGHQRRIVKLAPNEPAYTVLHKLRAARSTMAVVLDGSGGGQPLGIVTWEDAIRRLVKSAG